MFIVNSTGEKPQTLEGDIEFRNITFSYPSRPDEPVFTNFNLKIPRGKTVAIVGERLVACLNVTDVT